MNEMERFNIAIPKDEREKKIPDNGDKQPEENGLTRRRFLQLGTATLATLAFSGWKFMHDSNGKTTETLLNQTPDEIDTIPDKTDGEGKENVHESIEIEDMDVIGKTFQEQIETQDHVVLNQSTRNAILQNWKEKYAVGSVNYRDGIVKGLERMLPWANEIKKIFNHHGVPEKYAYLAIAESHFSSKSVSKAGAIGPYQITQGTSQLEGFEIKVNAFYDERLDPLKSAELCAKHLRHSYERLGKSWDLAVLAYNGGFTEDFVKSIPRKERQLSKEAMPDLGEHTFKRGETLLAIAERYKTSLSLLFVKNALPEETNNFDLWIARMKNARENDRIKISPEQKIKVTLEDFYQWIEEEINKKIQEELTSNRYKVRPGETFAKIAEKFHMDLSLLQSLNSDSQGALIAGQELFIPTTYKRKPDVLKNTLSHFSENINYPGKFDAIWEIIQTNRLDLMAKKLQPGYAEIPLKRIGTLKEIAIRNNLSLKELTELNPAIKNFSLRLPIGFKLRLPNQKPIEKSNTGKI